MDRILSHSQSLRQLFETIEEDIRATFDKIVETAIERRNYLITQLTDIKIEYLKKEQTRIELLQDLTNLNSQLNNAKINQSPIEKVKKGYMQKVQDEIRKIRQCIPMSVNNLNTDSLLTLLNQIENFAFLEETPYVKKSSPLIRVGTRRNEEGKVITVNGMTLDVNENVYITDLTNKRIQVFSNQGECIDSFGAGVLIKPHSVTVNNGFVFVTDIGGDNVHKFRSEDYVHVSSSDGGGFDFPLGITSDPDHLYVADSNRNRIAVISFDFEPVQTFGDDQLYHPRDLECFEGKLYVVDNGLSYNVHIFLLPNGGYSQSMIWLQEGLGHIFMSIDIFGNFLFNDRKAGSIQVFNKVGQLMHIIKCDGDCFGIAVARDHSIFCATKSDSQMIAIY